MRKAGIKQEESNSLIQSIVPSASTRRSNLNLPITNQSNMQFEISRIGFMTDYIFYIPDEGDSTGIAFSEAYKAATMRPYDKELCTYVGSMLCSVVPGFRNSVVAALNGIGVRPHFVSLPSQAEANNIDISRARQLDWSSILVIFGYCILLLFKIDNDELFWFDTSKTPNTERIRELKVKVGFSTYNSLSIPFDRHREKEIRTMLGNNHALRTSVFTFLMNNFDHPDSQICSLCQYLSVVLSWSGDMRVFTVMNKWLVKTHSRVLSISRLKEEVDNLEETINAIASHSRVHVLLITTFKAWNEKL
jgi:hypothetical protein